MPTKVKQVRNKEQAGRDIQEGLETTLLEVAKTIRNRQIFHVFLYLVAEKIRKPKEPSRVGVEQFTGISWVNLKGCQNVFDEMVLLVETSEKSVRARVAIYRNFLERVAGEISRYAMTRSS